MLPDIAFAVDVSCNKEGGGAISWGLVRVICKAREMLRKIPRKPETAEEVQIHMRGKLLKCVLPTL